MARRLRDRASVSMLAIFAVSALTAAAAAGIARRALAHKADGAPSRPRHAAAASPSTAKRAATPGAVAVAVAGAAAPAVVHVPRARVLPVIDGEFEDPVWRDGATRIALTADGPAGAPYADVRLTWGDGVLALALYASDGDIRARADDGAATADLIATGDAFRLTFAPGPDASGPDAAFRIDVSALGAVRAAARARVAPGAPLAPWRGWESGVRAKSDVDGTPNDPSDDDEEWVDEVAVPLASLGLRGVAGERIRFAVGRCDVGGAVAGRCASWGAGPGGAAADGDGIAGAGGAWLVLDP